MTTIASLVVNLGMNSAKFNAGTKSARVSLGSLAAGGIALNAAMGLAQSAIGAAQRGLHEFTDAAKGIDSINDLAEATGHSTEGIITLQHAAQMSGVEISTLDSSLKRLNISLGKALGGGESAKAFKQLGLDAEALAKAGPDKTFTAVAEAISKIDGPAAKAAAAVGIFGKSGAELINVLNLGEKGLSAMRAEAQSLGILFDKMAAQQVAKAADEMDRASSVIKGAKQQIAIGLAPAVEYGALAFRHLVSEVKGGNVLFGLTNALGMAADDMNGLTQYAFAAATASKKQATAIDDVTEAVTKQSSAVSKLQTFYDALYERESARFNLIEAGLTPLEQYESKQAEIQQMLRELEKDRFGYTTPLVSDDDYEYQKAHLERQLEVNRKAEEDRVKEEGAGSFVGKIKAAMESPLAKYTKAIAEIDSNTFVDPIFGTPSDKLNAEQSQFAKLQARKDYLEGLDVPESAGPERAAALERGSAVAFSASFGQKQIEKTQAELLRVNKDIKTILRDKLPTVATIAA